MRRATTAFIPPDVSEPPFKLPARNKYRARKTVADGITFDSGREAKRYLELKLLERGGYIKNLELQKEFRCEVNGKLICRYRADFIYFEGMQRRVEDSKGFRTREYKIKKKLVEALYNVTILEV